MVNTDKIKRGWNVNGAVIYALCLAWVFTLVYATGDKGRLVYVMNAFLFGSMVALGIMYYRYLWFVITNPDAWNRARQFIMSTGVVWAGITAVVMGSIWRNSTVEYNVANTNFIDILARYLFIIAATMQVFAPHHGEKMTIKDERQSLIIASVTGLAVAMVAMFMQSRDVMSW